MARPALCTVLVTCPKMEQAAALARSLVEERLIACANLVPGVRSIYLWQGAVCDEAEVLLIAKTTPARFEALRARVVALHPYQVPEVLMLGVEKAHGPYRDWVRASVLPAKKPRRARRRAS